MATNEFKVFDENNQNVLSDDEYRTHTQRLNGVVAGVADSKMHNKLFKQASTMAAAIGDAIAEAGLDATDKDKNQLKENIKKTFGGGKIIIIPQGQEVERKPNQLYFKVTDQQSSSGANNVVAGPNNMQLEVQDIIEPILSQSGINFE